MNDNINKKNVSVYRDMVTPTYEASIEEIYNWIVRGTPEVELKVQQLRQLYKEGSPTEADNIKKKIPAFTVSGICREKRSNQNLWAYSQYLVLDLDNLTPEELREARERAKAIAYTVMAFVSPSGYGLKIIVRVDSQKNQHTIAYQQVRQYYEGELGHTFDNTQDCARLCFLSYDPGAYLNPDFSVFSVHGDAPQSATIIPLPIAPLPTGEEENMIAKFDWLETFTNNVKKFEEGSRNDYIHLLAANANRYGMPKEIILEFAVQKYQCVDFEKSEIVQAITSAYKKRDVFGSYKWPANVENIEEDEEEENMRHANNPYIPDDVIENLPEEIRSIALLYSSKRERDIFVISFLTIMSGALPKVSGSYDGNIYTPALFSYVVAPPASGKGVIKDVRSLFEPYHRKLKRESEKALLKYKEELEAYEREVSRGTVGLKAPEKPPYKVLFIPGNTTPAAIYKHLSDSDGFGVFCETEADAFSQNLKHDLASRSALLRNAFQHENISSSRKSDGLIEISSPKIAALFGSTPAQVLALIPSTEDGLFSRFLFYSFFDVPQWHDVSPAGGKGTLPALREKLGEQLVVMIEWLNNCDTTIELSTSQWDKLNMRFGSQLSELTCFHSTDIGSSVKRNALSTFRIAMVFTAMRKYKERQTTETVVCSDRDFDMAMELSAVFMQHAVAVHKDVPKPTPLVDGKLRKIYDALPDGKFDRKTAFERIKQAGINKSDRWIDRLLKKMVDHGMLTKDDFNIYYKSDPQQKVAA